MNILFTSAGRRVVLLKLFRQALDQLGEGGVLVAVDAQASAPAFQAADFAYVVPRIPTPEYIPALLKICRKHRIDALFPCFDPDLAAISRSREQFEQAGFRPVLAHTQAIQACYKKYATFEFFSEHNIPTVNTVPIGEFAPADDWVFPLFVKPMQGYGSINSHPVLNFQELESYRERVPDAVVQELATGIEYTLDVLADFDGVVLSVVPRQRIEVRAGEVSKGVTRKNWMLIEWAQKIVEALGAIGPLCIQCFLDGEQVRFTEINPRYGGGLPLSVAAGAQQVLWMVQLLQGKKLEPMIGQFQDNYLMLRYDDAYFMPEAKLGELPCLKP
jgi:carbamoyl-phosphate synthase large subunit